MKVFKFLFFQIVALLLTNIVVAQEVSIKIVSDNDEIILCPNDKNLFQVELTGIDDEMIYKWDFDNGDVFTSNTNEIEYAYDRGGAYMLRVTASNDDVEVTDVVKVKVGLSPYFGDYRNDIDKSFSGICLGETFTLEMPIKDVSVEYNYSNSYFETKPQIIFDGTWRGVINLKNFADNNILSINDIKSINVTISCDNTDNLNIQLTTPDSKQIILYENGKTLPDGIDYKSEIGAMKTYKFTPNIVPELSNIVGSPINGNWIIDVKTIGLETESYILGVELILDDEIVAQNTWNYLQKYDLRRAVWSGRGISATSSGIADATPPTEGTTRYVFLINDDFGCSHDTSVFVSVERAGFSGADSVVYIGDEINFRNLTSWVNQTTWTFGDNSLKEYTVSSPHVYYERGNYEVIMTSVSEKNCVDVDTQYVNIVPRPLEVKEVNIFTPNGDGVNDVFTFFDEKESFLSNGGLTKMPANIRSLRCKIYNSYGKTICKWENVTPSIFGWDGTIDNKGTRPCPPGTYFYDLIVFGKDGNSIKRSGTILLVRDKDSR